MMLRSSISGYQRAEILGKNLLEFIAPEDQESAVKNMILMFERKLGPREYTLIMKDGKKIPFEINSDVLRRNDGSLWDRKHLPRYQQTPAGGGSAEGK